MENKNYCCEDMKTFIEDPRIKINYNAEHRMYHLEITSTGKIHLIHYCPSCGALLPKNLVDKWFETLEKELNIDDPYDTEQKKLIPE